MTDSLNPSDTYMQLLGTILGFAGFLYDHNTWKFEPPMDSPVQVDTIEARIERLGILDRCYDHLSDAMASADALADDMDPKCWQSILVAIGETRQLMGRIDTGTDIDYTDPQQFDRLSATVHAIFRKQYTALVGALARLEILLGSYKLDPDGLWTERDWETFFGAKDMEPSQQRLVLSGLGLDLDWDAFFDEKESGESLIPAEDVTKICYELDDSGALELEIRLTGRGPIKCKFMPNDGGISNQAKLLFCVLRGKGTAPLAKIALALYADARSGGKRPKEIPRTIAATAHHVNKKAGVKLLKFFRSKTSGTAHLATSNIFDRSRNRENYNSRKGTLPGDRENT